VLLLGFHVITASDIDRLGSLMYLHDHRIVNTIQTETGVSDVPVVTTVMQFLALNLTVGDACAHSSIPAISESLAV